MRRMMMALAGSALLQMASCSPAPEKKAEEAAPAVAVSVPVSAGTVLSPTAPWSCADGQGFALTIFSGPDYAELVFPDGAKLHLAQTPSASGVLYEDLAHSFHTKGEEALFIANGATTTCHAAEGPN